MAEATYQLVEAKREVVGVALFFPDLPVSQSGIAAYREGIEQGKATFYFDSEDRCILLCPFGAKEKMALKCNLNKGDLENLNGLFRRKLEVHVVEHKLVIAFALEGLCTVKAGAKGVIVKTNEQSFLLN